MSFEKYKLFIRPLHHGDNQSLLETLENLTISEDTFVDVDKFMRTFESVIENQSTEKFQFCNLEEFTKYITDWAKFQKSRNCPDLKIEEQIVDFQKKFENGRAKILSQSFV